MKILIRLFFLFSIVIIGLVRVPASLAYFADLENSGTNNFSTTSLDFSLRDLNDNTLSSPLFNDSDIEFGYIATKSARIKKEGALDFNYDINVEKTGGDNVLCEALKVEVKLESVSKYSGSLLALELSPPILVSSGEDDWEIIVSLESNNGELRNKTCAFDLVFSGWQEESDGTWGFRDEERVGNIVTSGYWGVAKDIVLNEILYDPVGSDDGTMPNGEWIELYNNGNLDIDVLGWQIKDEAHHTITISTTNSDNNADTTDSGETVVPSNGFLVVYVNGGAIFNNNGDTVYLYDLTSNLIDSHTYLGGKSEGATEARIPDGIGSWVDPIATPGKPNKIEEIQSEQTQEDITNDNKTESEEEIGEIQNKIIEEENLAIEENKDKSEHEQKEYEQESKDVENTQDTQDILEESEKTEEVDKTLDNLDNIDEVINDQKIDITTQEGKEAKNDENYKEDSSV